MIAIQFRTVKEPPIRDTRDIWELREDLVKEKEMHSTLLREMRSIDETIEKYETERQTSKELALRDTLNELKIKAGLTDMIGPGILLSVEPVMKDMIPGQKVFSVSPQLLKRLINELNQFGASHLAIDEQRIINTSVIRDINGDTTVNGVSLSSIPFEIKVITKDYESAEKLFKQMQVSKAIEDFFIDNLQVSISSPKQEIKLPSYDKSIRIRLMEPVEQGGN